MVRNIAVIPARGGSKRIPQKNIVNLCGKPMIAWTIEAAKKTKLFNRIIVSTDDKEIADISIKYGAEVPFLRQMYADDNTPVSIATIYSVKKAMEYYDEKYDNVFQLMANCPLRTAKDIEAAYEHFMKSNNYFQISCCKFGWLNPWWALKLDSDFSPTNIINNTQNMRSQDLEELYCPTGAVWIAKYRMLVKEETFYGKNYKMYPISTISGVDIDNYSDLEIAEIFMKNRVLSNGKNNI